MTGGGQSSSNQEPGIAPQSIGYITNHIQKQNEKNPTRLLTCFFCDMKAINHCKFYILNESCLKKNFL